MSAAPKRATVYFKPEIHRALRGKAAESDCSISDLVNAAVKETLAEDAETQLELPLCDFIASHVRAFEYIGVVA